MPAENINRLSMFSRDDASGFFALLADNLANMIIVAGVCIPVIGIPADVVFGRILPGLGLSLVFGLTLYAWMARRLAAREGRTDVTALPYGISTPVLFVFLFGVILPVRIVTRDPVLAWQVGIAAAFLGGVIELLGSLVGPWLKRVTPRAGMLGTLAGIALVWIAAVPMAEILEHPEVGLPAFAIILVGLVARRRLPFGIPAGLAAIVVGALIAAGMGTVHPTTKGVGLYPPIPVLGDLWAGLSYLWSHPKILLIVVPLEIYNFIETMNNVESAEAAGDKYDVAHCQLVDGAGTMLGALFGSAFPTTVYIGHPAYKRLGARSGYALGVGIVLFLGAFFGLLALLKSLVPIAAVAPLLVFVAIMICGQACSAVPTRHLPAVALAMIPHIGDILTKRITGTLDVAGTYLRAAGAELPAAVQSRAADLLATGAAPPKAVTDLLLNKQGIHLTGQSVLSHGAILIGLLWGAIAAFCIDGKLLHAAAFTLAAAALTILGFIHTAGLGWDGVVVGYAVMSALLLAWHYAGGNDPPLDGPSRMRDCSRLRP
ncbi:MAG: xanthine/uracil/vitamin C permease [bacterium]